LIENFANDKSKNSTNDKNDNQTKALERLNNTFKQSTLYETLQKNNPGNNPEKDKKNNNEKLAALRMIAVIISLYNTYNTKNTNQTSVTLDQLCSDEQQRHNFFHFISQKIDLSSSAKPNQASISVTIEPITIPTQPS
jgi:hypothetical protein